jgi:flagellar hook-associated protein 3 FlgL
MRITTSQIFSQNLKNISSSLCDVTMLNMMTSSQKRINTPSDDPHAAGLVTALRSYDQKLSGYGATCTTATSWLGTADDILVSCDEVVSAAMELAEQGATGTYSGAQLADMGLEMRGYLETMLQNANARSGNDHLFSGNKVTTPPYAYELGATLPNTAMTSADFASFSGETDSTISVEFLDAGTVGTDLLSYRYSTDGGTTWSTGTLDGTATPPETTLDLGSAQVELASGTTVSAADGEDGSQFLVRPTLVYQGGVTAMSVNISQNMEMDITTVGSTAFGGVDAATGTPCDAPNLFETMSDLVAYMETGDQEGVEASLESLRQAQIGLQTASADVGTREIKTEYTKTSLDLMSQRTQTHISNEENASATQLSIELAQAEYVYEAVLKTAETTMGLSLLNYL